MTPKFLIAGYLTRDHIAGREQPGGSALYGSKTAQRLGLRSAIWTSAASDFPPASLLEGIETVRSNSNVTTTFAHRYDHKSGERFTSLESAAPPLTRETLPTDWKSAHVVMIAPNWTEIAPESLNWFSTKWIGLTPQGWFRYRDDQGIVSFGPSRFLSLPRKVALTVVSVDDIAGDPNAWNWIKKYSDVAVRTMGKKGHVVAFKGDEKLCLPPWSSEEIDPTGAGDVFSAAMLIALSEGADPIEASAFGSVAASFAVERAGVGAIATRAEVEQRRRDAPKSLL